MHNGQISKPIRQFANIGCVQGKSGKGHAPEPRVCVRKTSTSTSIPQVDAPTLSVAEIMTDAVGGQWAGNYECSCCGKKRLTAASFSRKQLDKRRQNESLQLKCKDCVDAAAREERDKAVAKAAAVAAEVPVAAEGAAQSHTGGASLLTCCRCKAQLPHSAFTNTQAHRAETGKGGGGKCRDCTAAAEAEEHAAAEARGSVKLQTAQRASASAAGRGRGGAGAFARLQGLGGRCVALAFAPSHACATGRRCAQRKNSSTCSAKSLDFECIGKNSTSSAVLLV
ncbi:hypothetical protein JKP88DRAFT_267459 [Tribonema minus]|uniref:Stc1 domain-containing protein n=1 Tax=Tribonema minus TaxID=303371 RepID=A0A835Z8C9_9STRA|nr:hypothetical protein JKP88DRAFT_267459 [Tribonema minus]